MSFDGFVERRPTREMDKPLALYAETFCRQSCEVVARAYLVTGHDIRRPTRCRKRIAQARQVAMYLSNVAGGIAFVDVARGFGRDRTTVAHACAVVEDLRDDLHLDRALMLLEGALRRTFRLADLHARSPMPPYPTHPCRRRRKGRS